MNVLMVNTPDAPQFKGGDLTQMRKVAEVLRSRGVGVTESFDLRPDPTGCDLAHVFNLRTVNVTPGQVQHLKSKGVPVVMSPIYLDPSVALWATQAMGAIFGQKRTPEERTRLLAMLARREMKVQVAGGTMSARGTNRPHPNYDQLQAATLAMVDYLAPNGALEMHALSSVHCTAGKPFTIVPYAADPNTFLNPDPEPFVAKFGMRDFVLQVGRIEPSKNTLMTALAMRGLGLPLVLIGGQRHPAYLDWVKQHGPPGMLMLPHLTSEELRSAYAAARVHVLPSWIETCGLVHMEAALADCSLVCSTAGYEVEFFQGDAEYCDPADVGSIRDAVQRAFENHESNAPRRRRLREHLLRDYTWEKAADATMEAYLQILGR